MNRLARCVGAAILASALACSSMGGPSPTLDVTVARFEIPVDVEARVGTDSVHILPGQTEVIWTGSPEVKSLWVAFKNVESKSLNDPVCVKATCTFAREESVGKQGTFNYLVIVKLKNGKWRLRDPRLIIHP